MLNPTCILTLPIVHHFWLCQRDYMRSIHLALLICFATTVSACVAISPAARQCRAWQNEGRVVSSLDSCVKCVNNLGTPNPDTIQGCAIGMDAAGLLNVGK